MGPEIVYVSGRVRPPGEMNGKSGNMNNCLGQIYPKEHRIPGNELVCVFDADQVAKKDFFLKTLPFFDAGGLHGLLLSCALPQCGLSMGRCCHVLCLRVGSVSCLDSFPKVVRCWGLTA